MPVRSLAAAAAAVLVAAGSLSPAVAQEVLSTAPPVRTIAPAADVAQAPSYPPAAGRVEVERYLQLQEKYARGLTQSELESYSAQLEQQVRNQQVARKVASLETEIRELLGEAVGTPSEQTVQDVMKVLEARYNVPRGQQVYFEKKYRAKPTRRPTTTQPSTSSPSSSSRSTARPVTPPTTTYPAPTYSTPSYGSPTYSQPYPGTLTPQPYGY